MSNPRTVTNNWLKKSNYQQINKVIAKLEEAGYNFKSRMEPGNHISMIITHPSYSDKLKLKNINKVLFVDSSNKLLKEIITYLTQN